MNSILKRSLTMLTLGLLLLVSACQDTIPQRTIAASKAIDPASCTGDKVYDPTTKKCIDVVEPTRPANAVTFQDGYCICNDGKAVSYGNCSAFCAGKGTSATDRLYASFNVTEAVSLSGLKNVFGWCTTPLTTESTAVNPSCVLEAKTEDGSVTDVPIQAISGNSIQVDVSSYLAFDKTYVLTLKEVSSKVTSNSVQVVKFSVETPISALGPLKISPISQYTCIVRYLSGSSTTASLDFVGAYRMHFYFLPSTPPNFVPANVNNLFCHDINLYGNYDDPEEDYPRLELTQGAFSLWSSADPRFHDNNANKYLDVNDVIVQKTKNFGGNLPETSNFFAQFSWPGSPTISSDAGNSSNTSTTSPIGYYMAPWIDQTTFKSYCLTATHYDSGNPVYRAMKDVIGVDTEGLYIGMKAAESVMVDGVAKTGLNDYILIRETDLKQVWFYSNNGVLTAPTDANVDSKAVYFYYPINKANPYVKSASQRRYQVKGAKELSGSATGSATTSGTTTTPPHDRKIGCIPKLAN